MFRCYIAVTLFVGAIAFSENAKVISNETILDGVKTETHRVVTDDLYVLHVLRMQNVLNSTRHNHSVLVLHSMGGSSDIFTGHGRNLSLAYSLVDAGFDIWLGNVRGNKYSRHHLYLNPDDPVDKRKFFNYTYENIGLFDIPATVDYILNHTNTTKLHYIGYSQGGTAFLVLNSMRPEYNEKFVSAQLLAAAGYYKHFSNTVLLVLSKIADILYKFLTDLGIVEWHYLLSKSSNNGTNNNQIDVCLGKRGYNELCEILNEDGLLGTLGSGGAIKQQVHFGQNIHSRKFRRWDFGKETNLQVYGTLQPPNYNLSLITVPTVMHYGHSDVIVNSRDVLEMAWQMPHAKVRQVPRVDFGHSDFVDGPDAPDLVYEFIIDTLLYFEDNKVRVWTSPAAMTEPPYVHYPADTIGADLVPMDPNRSTCNVLNEALLFIILTLKLN